MVWSWIRTTGKNLSLIFKARINNCRCNSTGILERASNDLSSSGPKVNCISLYYTSPADAERALSEERSLVSLWADPSSADTSPAARETYSCGHPAACACWLRWVSLEDDITLPLKRHWRWREIRWRWREVCMFVAVVQMWTKIIKQINTFFNKWQSLVSKMPYLQ